MNLPLGAVAAIPVFLFFKAKSAPKNDPLLVKLKSLDGLGFILFAASITMLLLALEFAGSNAVYAWNSSVIIGLLVGFGVALLSFVAWQLCLQNAALVPPRLFKYRNASLIFISLVFVNGPFQTIVYWLPIWFQTVLGTHTAGIVA